MTLHRLRGEKRGNGKSPAGGRRFAPQLGLPGSRENDKEVQDNAGRLKEKGGLSYEAIHTI